MPIRRLALIPVCLLLVATSLSLAASAEPQAGQGRRVKGGNQPAQFDVIEADWKR